MMAVEVAPFETLDDAELAQVVGGGDAATRVKEFVRNTVTGCGCGLAH